jgi:hypothetical protein
VPESIAGPLYPEGYKYGRLAIQVGGWAEGQQPVTLKKLSGNEKFDLETVGPNGINLGNGRVLMR